MPDSERIRKRRFVEHFMKRTFVKTMSALQNVITNKSSNDEVGMRCKRIALRSCRGYHRAVDKPRGRRRPKCEPEEHARRGRRALPARSAYERISTWFLAVGTPVRLKLLMLVLDEELDLPALASMMKADSGMVSRQLAVLREAGLVTMIRHGRQVGYRVTRGGEADRFLRLVVSFANPHL